MYPQSIYVLSKNIKNVNLFPMKYSIIFASEKNLCILHGQVFVMLWDKGSLQLEIFGTSFDKKCFKKLAYFSYIK